MIIITYLGVNKYNNKIKLGWLKLKHLNSVLFRKSLAETVINLWNFQSKKWLWKYQHTVTNINTQILIAKAVEEIKKMKQI